MREKFALYMRKVIFAEFSNIMAVEPLTLEIVSLPQKKSSALYIFCYPPS